ncbi:nuclear fragile X mental retardation-interacting protein 1-domain-containing protein [Dipodascopsis uninucleata]
MDNSEYADEEALASMKTVNEGKVSQIITIPGTNISLQTQEDIAKWISERRKNWPSVKRMEEKAKEEEEKKQRLSDAKEMGSNRSATDQSSMAIASNICKYYWKNGRCNRGDRCSFKHEQPLGSFKIYKRFEKPKSMSLFKRLVQNDWDQENDRILDFIIYLVETGKVPEKPVTS